MVDDKQNDDAPAQRTEKGLEIPVPQRDDVFKAFEKVAKASGEPKNEQGPHASRRPLP